MRSVLGFQCPPLALLFKFEEDLRAMGEDVNRNEVRPTHLLQCVRLQGCHGGLQEMEVGNREGGCADKGK